MNRELDRAASPEKLPPTPPLPYISRRALRRVKDALPPPETCPYCGGPVRLVENSEIYRGRSYGDWPYAYRCGPCDARVGLHPGTDLPLGTLANAELRSLRVEAKAQWQRVVQGRGWGRSQGYKWLAEEMGIPAAECHFGHFDEGRAGAALAIAQAAAGADEGGPA